jgi:hypothetical protein
MSDLDRVGVQIVRRYDSKRADERQEKSQTQDKEKRVEKNRPAPPGFAAKLWTSKASHENRDQWQVAGANERSDTAAKSHE